MKKFRVHKSTDTRWVRWGVTGLGWKTEWFDSQEAAQKRADTLNAKIDLCTLWRNRPCE